MQTFLWLQASRTSVRSTQELFADGVILPQPLHCNYYSLQNDQLQQKCCLLTVNFYLLFTFITYLYVKSVIVLWFKRSIYIQLWALVATKPCVEALWRLTTSLNIAPNTKAYIVFQGMISDHRNLERCAGLLLTLKDEPLEPPQRAGFYLNTRDGRQWLLNMPLSAVVVIVI